ncbi:DUF4153 domain-containing protein [Actinoplanes teichomyceticus]|uniref:Uncharacterized protein DUF4173 n=1 Tax=Actinoplanes teichomyceticus TaxID=1867 RepID=A0A561WKR1_ACTTI|nr:DUF4173 domain-containing protein [Actinoplanes teichomyceticus]TWG24457.1 uncharacterized protein DUF4173 [Actinoplanes teichomyceticus]GIF12692.1 hypothetical protein Ate01nite_27240 [Actinoplanes teichomyceticus]
MAELPPEQRDPTDPARPVAGAHTDAPAAPAPPLLVMPPTDALPSMVWPGPDGAPAWAIPVQIPSGTRGYALFVPMVPVQSPATTDPAGPGTAPATDRVADEAVPGSATAARMATGAAPDSAVAARPTVTAGHREPSGATASEKPASAQPGPAQPASEQPGSERPGPERPGPAQPGPGQPGSAQPGAGSPGVKESGADPAGPEGSGAGPAGGSGAGTTATRRPAATPAPAGPTPESPRPRPEPAPAFLTRNDPRTAPPPPPFPRGPYKPEPTAWQRFRDKHWPGPATTRGRAVPAGVLAGALGFAFLVPLTRTGIGWFLGWLVLTLGVVGAVRRSADLPRSERWIRSGWAAAALALLLVPAFRNAWWLVTFSVLGALGCAALAIVGGRLVRSILFSLVATPYAALRGLPWVRRHLRGARDPGLVRRIGFSAALTVVVLLVFGALLSSADVAFSALLDEAVPDLDGGSVFRWIFLAVTGALIAVAGIYTLSAPPATSSLDTPGRGRFGLIEWAPAGSALVLLFGGFVAVQFTVLFGGRRHVLRTSGLSYAEYARSGFWQLVAVTLLSLAVVAALARWARRDQPIDRVLLRVLLGLLCGLSVVIVASALSRMWAYQKVYSFTGERIFVMSSEMLLGIVFVLVAAAGVRWNGRWIPRATVGLAVLMLLGLAVLDPEGYAARRNTVRYEQTGKIDAWYLRALSADATPALTRLPDPVRRCTLSWIAEDLAEPDPWYAWNLGRSRAREALRDLGPGAIGDHADCRAADQFDLPKKRR